jgi:hypothetical protein
MPQNISVVIIDSDTDSINSIVKYGDKKYSLRVKLRGEAEANSEIRRFSRKKLRNLAFALRLPRSKRPRNDGEEYSIWI